MSLKSLLAQRRPLIMGIVNLTPDSFSDGGSYNSVEKGLSHALGLIRDGADVLDIGGESTRPGADPVSADEEIARVVPVIEALKPQWDGVISIDTMKPEVARAAVAAGAGVWNDVTALSHDADSLTVASELGCEIVLMHMKGDPKTMQSEPHYEDVLAEVEAHLLDRTAQAEAAGVAREKIWLDPGIGFAKTLTHNLALTAGIERLCATGYPVLYAASRKRLIGEIDPAATKAEDRLGGTLALHLAAVAKGAAMVRVHDVRAMKQALLVQAALDNAERQN